MESLPKDLMYYMNQVQNYTKNTVKLQTLNQSNLSTRGATQCRLALPVNAIVNMKSLSMHCEVQTHGVSESTSGANNAVVPLIPKGGLSSLIDRVTWSAGGQSLDNGATPYHVVKNVKDNLEKSLSKQDSDEKVLNNSVIEPTGTNGTSGDSNNGVSKQLVLNNFLGVTQCHPSYVDLNLLPEMFMTLQLADASVLPVQQEGLALGADTTNANFTGTQCYFELKNIFFTIEVISIGNGLYDALTSRLLSERGAIDIPYHQYQVFSQDQSGAGGSIRGSVSTQSLNKIYAFARSTKSDEEYNVQMPPKETNAGAGGFSHIQTAHKFVSAGIQDWQFTVNNAPYPLYKPDTIDAFNYAVCAEERTYDKCGGCLITSQDMWKGSCWVAVQKLCHDNEITRMSGLNLMSINSQIAFTATGAGTGSSDPRQVMLMTEQTSTIRIGANRAIAVIA